MALGPHFARLPSGCPRCGAAGERSYTAAYRRNGLCVAMGFRCEQCRDGIEWDGDELDETARSAFYASEGKWALHLVERGSRGVEVLQMLRTLRNEGVSEVMRFVGSGAPIVEGTLVEIEHAEHCLSEIGAATERRREGDDPDLLMAARRSLPLEEQLRAHEDLWNKDAHRYELHEVGHARPRALIIYDRETSGLLLIDGDDHLAEQIMLRMLAAGVPVRPAPPMR